MTEKAVFTTSTDHFCICRHDSVFLIKSCEAPKSIASADRDANSHAGISPPGERENLICMYIRFSLTLSSLKKECKWYISGHRSGRSEVEPVAIILSYAGPIPGIKRSNYNYGKWGNRSWFLALGSRSTRGFSHIGRQRYQLHNWFLAVNYPGSLHLDNY